MPSFSVVLPLPPSWNSAYRIVKPRGLKRTTLAKTDEAWTWQTAAAAIVKHARPADFAASGDIRLRYWWKLGRWNDLDNLKKLTHDAIAYGLGTKMGKTKPMPIWDDKLFLSCDMERSIGNQNPEVMVEISWTSTESAG